MQERLWRKNRMITDSPLGCVGIDLNRNWDTEFKNVAPQKNPCAEDFQVIKIQYMNVVEP